MGISEEDFRKLEKFVLEVYSMRHCSSLAEARVEKFRTSPDSNLRKLPPGKNAQKLVQQWFSEVFFIENDLYETGTLIRRTLFLVQKSVRHKTF